MTAPSHPPRPAGAGILPIDEVRRRAVLVLEAVTGQTCTGQARQAEGPAGFFMRCGDGLWWARTETGAIVEISPLTARAEAMASAGDPAGHPLLEAGHVILTDLDGARRDRLLAEAEHLGTGE